MGHRKKKIVDILLDGQELIYSRDYQALEVTPITE